MTADGAGVEALCGVLVRARRTRVRCIVRALRWKRDAVCRDASADEEVSGMVPDTVSGPAGDSAGSSITRTIFFSSRIQTQTQTRKETNHTNQKKKGKNKKQVTISQKIENLA